jgi:antitoxin ParD1/3/4
MNVSLTPQLESFVKKKLDSGLYYSASEVIRDGLRLLEEKDQMREMKLAELKKEIQLGLNSLDRGEGIDGEEVFAEIEREAAKEQ